LIHSEFIAFFLINFFVSSVKRGAGLYEGTMGGGQAFRTYIPSQDKLLISDMGVAFFPEALWQHLNSPGWKHLSPRTTG